MAAEPNMVKNTASRITPVPVRTKVKASPFDATVCSHFLPVGEHKPTSEEALDQTVFTSHIKTVKKNPMNPDGTSFAA